MFIYSIIIAIVIGYIFKGKLRNLEGVKLNGLLLVILGFGIDAGMQFVGKIGILKIGTTTFILDLLMYILMFSFIYLNRKNFYVILIGIGFLLNAVVIFANGGAMPVSQSAMNMITKNYDPTKSGLYVIMDNSSRFRALGDIMYMKLLGPGIFSIGDIVLAIGIMLIIIKGMCTTPIKTPQRITNRNKRSRRSKRVKKSIKDMI